MRLFIKVKTRSKKPGVERLDESNFIVRVKEAPIEGRANEAVIKALAENLGIASWRIKILSGSNHIVYRC
jgi:hypothetical protein